MLFVSLRERIVQRCTDPTSQNYKKITKMTSRTIEDFSSKAFDIIPRNGEIISLGENKAYQVIAVIHSRRCCAGLLHPEIIVEVVPYVPEHTYDAGGYFIKEYWPLISDLPFEKED